MPYFIRGFVRHQQPDVISIFVKNLIEKVRPLVEEILSHPDLAEDENETQQVTDVTGLSCGCGELPRHWVPYTMDTS